MGLVFFWKYWPACGELRSFDVGKDAGCWVDGCEQECCIRKLKRGIVRREPLMCQGLRDGALDCLKGTVFVSELELVVGDLRVWSWVTVTAWMLCGLSSIFPLWKGCVSEL